MQAEIITIGDEILIGQIIDTNSAWMGQQLNLVGIDVTRISSISDDKTAIVDALDHLYPSTQLVLITGGLGPTKDDLTKLTLCEYFGMELTFREDVYAHILALFHALGRVPAAVNREQALLPDGCRVLHNGVGTAPGMLFEHKGKHFISMPGVPYEMKHIMQNHVMPIIAKELLRQYILHSTVLTVGVPESELAERLESFEAQLPAGIKLAYLPRPGMVRLRLTAKGSDEGQVAKLVSVQENLLKATLGKVVYGMDADSLEKVIGDLLIRRKESIALAESCTGGYIAHLLTSVAGSSAYFLGGIVAYDNRVKMQQLGVEEHVLQRNGAVSEECAMQMAMGARAHLKSTWALATTGIAGPDGGTEEKPVGTVWIALAGPAGCTAHKYQFGTDRSRNIKKSAFAALDMLRSALIEEE